MGQSLHRLVYHSRSRFPEDLDAPAAMVRGILASSRARNEAANVTGALMLSAGCFGQVLEGPEETVLTIFNRIKWDDRHDQVALLAFEPVAERRFGQWSMRFVGERSPDANTGFDLSIATAADLFGTIALLAHANP